MSLATSRGVITAVFLALVGLGSLAASATVLTTGSPDGMTSGYMNGGFVNGGRAMYPGGYMSNGSMYGGN